MDGVDRQAGPLDVFTYRLTNKQQKQLTTISSGARN